MPSYAFYFLRSQEEHIKGGAGATFASINRGEIEKLQIPLPPLEVQKEIVAEIEGYQKVINGARAVLDNYRPTYLLTPVGRWCHLGRRVTSNAVSSRIGRGMNLAFTAASIHSFKLAISLEPMVARLPTRKL